MIYRALANTRIFILVYVLLMIPAYLTYVDYGSTIAHGSLGINTFKLPLFFHLGSMILLCYICFVRGKLIAKSWLGFIPLIAIAFELLPTLSAIPLVPSVYHALAIVVGSFTTTCISIPTDTKSLRS